MIEICDQFFTNTQLTAVLFSETQREDRILYVYFGDFLLQTNKDAISLRDKLLENGLVDLSSFGLKSLVNIHLEELVEELLREKNMVPASIDEIEDERINEIELNSKETITIEDIPKLPDANDHLWLGKYIGQGGVSLA